MKIKSKSNQQSLQSNDAQSIATIIFKGFSQIMLQESAVAGFLIVCGIFYGNIYMGLGSVIATVVSTLTARGLNYDHKNICKGLYGFNAALVGVAMVLFLKPGWFLWVCIVVGAALTAVLQEFFMNRKLPLFTFPFVFITWMVLVFGHVVLPYKLIDISSVSSAVIDYYLLGFKGYGQVVFQTEIMSGIIFFTAVLIASPIAALYGFFAATISAVVAVYLQQSIHDIGLGLLSFNAVLCAIVFAGKKWTDGVWVILSVLLSLIISIFMLSNGLPQLTFPFVASCFILVSIRNSKRFKKTGDSIFE